MRLFSYRDRPVHLGPYPLERLTRQDAMPELKALAPMQALSFDDADPESLKHAMARFITMFDLVRDGAVNPLRGEVPAGGAERAEHIKAAGYYFDASMMAICTLPREALLAEPIRNPRVPALGAELEASQPRSFAAGMDMILADVLDSARKVHGPVDGHTHAIVILVEYPRDPRADEPGCDWIQGTQAQRAAVLTAQTAVLLSTYLRMLGYEGRAHSATCSIRSAAPVERFSPARISSTIAVISTFSFRPRGLCRVRAPCTRHRQGRRCARHAQAPLDRDRPSSARRA